MYDSPIFGSRGLGHTQINSYYNIHVYINTIRHCTRTHLRRHYDFGMWQILPSIVVSLISIIPTHTPSALYTRDSPLGGWQCRNGRSYPRALKCNEFLGSACCPINRYLYYNVQSAEYGDINFGCSSISAQTRISFSAEDSLIQRRSVPFNWLILCRCRLFGVFMTKKLSVIDKMTAFTFVLALRPDTALSHSFSWKSASFRKWSNFVRQNSMSIIFSTVQTISY